MRETFSIGLQTAFGLESVVRDEAAGLGYEIGEVRNGRVTVSGGWNDVARLNMALRACDRVVLPLAVFPAATFDELYEGARKVDFPFPANARIMVTGKSVQSRLSAFEVCASVTKKALIDRTCERHQVQSLSAELPFRLTVSLRHDVAELYLDTTGAGLSFRGYRKLNGPAAIRETLAAGLLLLSGWKKDTPFWDPFCGTGTFPIEAGLLSRRIPPNLFREFDFLSWTGLDLSAERERLQAEILSDGPELCGSDVDPGAISMAAYHGRMAGVRVNWKVQDVRQCALFADRGTCVTNPPYGERISDRREAAELLSVLSRLFARAPGWNFGVITPERRFEQIAGGGKWRRRKLYNGGIECTFFQRFAQRKPLAFSDGL